MAEIKDYDAVAASNTSAPPSGAPEGMAPSTVNDVIREMMARLKRAIFDSMTINTTTAATGSPKLDVVADANADALCMSDNVTNATVKDGIVTCRHYTNAEETFTMIAGRSTDTENRIYYGGNIINNRNCATLHIFQVATDNTTLTGTDALRINSSGHLLIGHSTPSTGPPTVDIIGVANDGVIGISNTTVDATNKQGTIVGRSYTNSHEPIQIIGHATTSTTSIVRIGGGNSVLNAATELQFFTDAYNTAQGTQRLGIDTNGNVTIGDGVLADNATDGFLYIPTTTSGDPTGVPTTKTGRVAMVFREATNTLFVYSGGWQGVQLT
jgi:hypothetical protein